MVKVSEKKSMLEKFRANVLKDGLFLLMVVRLFDHNRLCFVCK